MILSDRRRPTALSMNWMTVLNRGLPVSGSTAGRPSLVSNTRAGHCTQQAPDVECWWTTAVGKAEAQAVDVYVNEGDTRALSIFADI